VLRVPQQRVDLVEDRAIAAIEARILAFVLLPRADDEHLLEEVGIGQIAMQVPVRRAGATASAADARRGVDKGTGLGVT
jgi:hypothetical protein